MQLNSTQTMNLTPTRSDESIVVDRAVGDDGTLFELVRESPHWMVRAAGRMLMSSQVTDSEEALAEYALEEIPNAEEVLVGGLGLGFTVRAVLDRVGIEATVTVAELIPSLVTWNHEHVGELSDYPLDDPRCEVVIGDVLETIKQSSRRFDAIVLDVDNGPVALSSETNQRLYTSSGIRACYDALRTDGILAVWSADKNPAYERRLRNAHFEVETVRVPAKRGSLARHVLFIAQRRPQAPRSRSGK